MPDTVLFATFLTMAFYLTLIIYVIYSVVLYYHWHNYSSDQRASAMTYGLYFAITLPLLALMGAVILFQS